MIKSLITKVLLAIAFVCFFSCTDEIDLTVRNAKDIGGDYYVSPDGDDDNPGTFNQPWATWQKAFDVASPGDTVYFRGGLYIPTTSAYGSNITMIDPTAGKPVGHTGEAGNRICYLNYPGETPILDCSVIKPQGLFLTAMELRSVSFVTFRGLTIRNVLQATSDVTVRVLMMLECSNLHFENFTIHNTEGAAFNYFSGMGEDHGIEYDTTRWINCDAYQNVDNCTVNPGNMADGWKCDQEKGGYLYFEGCRAWGCSDDGFDVSGSAIVVFTRCWAFSNGSYKEGNGNGFKVGAVRDSVSYPPVIITYCLSAYNHGPTRSAAGFDLIDWQLTDTTYYRVNARMYNNTAYNNDIGFLEFHNPTKLFRNSIFRNNISFGNTYTQDNIAFEVYIPDHPYIESHNSWDFHNDAWPPWFVYTDTVTVNKDDFVSMNPHGLIGPRKADGSLPDVTFLHLAEGSDLINAGTRIKSSDNVDLVLEYFGSAPDLGCFEKK